MLSSGRSDEAHLDGMPHSVSADPAWAGAGPRGQAARCGWAMPGGPVDVSAPSLLAS